MEIKHHIKEEELIKEKEWISDAQKNPERFSKLYDKYFEGIFHFIFRRTDDEDVAGDLTSQTFLSALQNIKKYEFRGVPFSAWLYRIAANQVNKYYRDHKKKVVFSLEESVAWKLLDEAEEDHQEEKLSRLVSFLEELSSEDMAVLELRFFEEKGFKEIAYILEISESGAKMRTYRAIEKLKAFFESRGAIKQ
ncbi:sigma-70 family RNA polymerase sigma factor [Fulvivirgaceae bacterium BMA10]|uniref:Sigma-70 family RNA polymerase sigma factor n=1 Tax=Splendidivirga corallicola TaxID=3051826 RepID=A0ABT8KRW3_9BACT|nr:sigma-70 family RNA polymerase sigma factor [Fulvivirgaceae bacterium BMA10]